jgi:hypothetical protein
MYVCMYVRVETQDSPLIASEYINAKTRHNYIKLTTTQYYNNKSTTV